MTHLPEEILSAHIDGEPLDPSAAAHVEECDTCRQRLDQFRHVSATVGAPVHPPAAHLREAAVAIALDEATASGGNIRSIRERRESAKSATRRMNAFSAAAALVVALGVGGWLLSQVGNESRNDPGTTTNALQDSAGGSESADAGASAFATDDGTTSASKSGFLNIGDIGEFSDVAAVSARYREWLAKPEEERGANATVLAHGEAPCTDPPNQPTGWMASLTFNGEAAWARVLFVTPESSRLEVLRQTDCGLLASQAI